MASRSKKIKRKLGAVIYYSVASKLPPSWSGMKLGQTAIRRFCARLMLDKCGSNVNIEKNALFSPKTTLGNNSGIGINAKIYGECHIGNGCIVAAGSVVTKDVPDYSIVGGVPARVIRSRINFEKVSIIE